MLGQVTKRNAALVVTLIIGIFCMFLIWPLRVFTVDVVLQGPGEIQTESADVTSTEDAGEYFTAQYSHLDTLEVYISSVESDGSFDARLFHELENGAMEILAEESEDLPDEPGYVTIPIDVEMTPGDTYVYILYAEDDAVFRVGYESGEVPDRADAIWYLAGFHHDTTESGYAVATRLNYRIPLPRGTSLGIIGGEGIATLVVCLFIFLFYRSPKRRNRKTTVLQVLRYVITPPAAALAVAGVIAVFPLRLYDTRALDIVMFETGIIQAFLILMYALWHKREGEIKGGAQEGNSDAAMAPQKDGAADGTAGKQRKNAASSEENKKGGVRHLLISILIALILAASCDYMNAVNDLIHQNAEYRIVLFTFLIVLLMGRMKKVEALLSGITAAAGAVCGGICVMGNLVPEDDPEHAARNLILVLLAAAYTAGAAAIVSTLTEAVLYQKNRAGNRKAGEKENKIGKKKRPRVMHTAFAAGWALFLFMLFIFRNGRHWILVMVILALVLTLRFALWDEKKRWLSDVETGILIQFAFAAAFSLLRRYYFAYIYSRFSMVFHTVTVTGYYLLIVSCVSLALMMAKLPGLMDMKGAPFKAKVSYIWKEALLFSVSSIYMLMTMTRAGIGGLVILTVFSVILVLRRKKDPLRPLRGIGYLLLMVICMFPSVFTLQRVVPVTVRSPYRFETIEPYPDEVARNMRPDSHWFMSVEVFIRDFGDRVIGGDIGTAIYSYFNWAEGQSVLKFDPRVLTWEDAPLPSFVERVSPLLAAEPGTINMTTGGDLEEGDYSNGRTDVWKAYISQLNMTGHESMNAVLPDGTLAIHAHNNFLQIAYDCGIPTGIVAAVFFVLTLIASCIYYRRRKNGHLSVGTALFPLLVTLGFIITGMVEWVFQLCNPFTLVLMLVILPVLVTKEDDSR